MKRLPNAAEAPRVLIAASGTGGHLFPAVYIAQQFRKVRPDARVEFVGSGRPLEEKLVDGRGFRRHIVRTVGVMRRGIGGSAEYLLTLPRAIRETAAVLRELQPHIVVGVGGYVSVLPALLGRLRGSFVWVHEGELKPGLANWLLSLIAHRTSIAFEQARMPLWARVVYTGHPVRPELRDLSCDWNRGDRPRRLLVMGGSQGAQALDEACQKLMSAFHGWGLAVWHQTRPENVSRLKAAYEEARVEAQVVPFIDDLPAAFEWSDLIVTRAGAGAVMEVGVVNKPAIFVPYPFAQGNHQFANAATLRDAGKALIVEQGDGFEKRLEEALRRLLDPTEYAAFRARPGVTRSTSAAEEIVRNCLELAGLRASVAAAVPNDVSKGS